MDSGWVTAVSSMLASFMFFYTIYREHFPSFLRVFFSRYTSKFSKFFSPYVHIKFPEQSGDRLKSNEAYEAVKSYLVSTFSFQAKNLRAEVGRDSKKLDLSMDDYEEVTDVFKGVKVWWTLHSIPVPVRNGTHPWNSSTDETRYYWLKFHRKHRDLIQKEYIEYVMEEGRANQVKRRQRKLYTNTGKDFIDYSFRSRVWSHVPFNHPATFETLALEQNKKKEIMEDLDTFSKSKDYYAKIGKVWKRGYLLYGPPGTGKSTMVAAIANLLEYDVYDLELTNVRDNTALRKLLIETTSKAVIVIEDIDCSLELTSKRKKGEKKDETMVDKPPSRPEEPESKVTLSGLLNFIDGLWSSCGGEKVIIFTTNRIEKLDKALIRRGRMDKHIELSYCTFEAFKVLARNYLGIEWHEAFEEVEELLKEVEITPADVAECLMPKSRKGSKEDITSCLEELLKEMKNIKVKVVKEALMNNAILDGEEIKDPSKS